MPTFVHEATFPHAQEEVWNWYDGYGAFLRIMPEWEGLKPVQIGALKDGEETKFRIKLGPLRPMWIARHHDVRKGESFSDSMVKGPFGKWDHVHGFHALSESESRVIDSIEWKLPFHFFTGWTSFITVAPRLEKMFRFRTDRTANDVAAISKTSHLPRKKILVTGSTGLIGTQLCAFLECAGHEVYRLVRPSTKLPKTVRKTHVIQWNETTGEILEGDLNGFDTVIHLAGAGIGDKRWSKKRKAIVRSSRVDTTKKLCEVLSKLSSPPHQFLCGSAIGYYGNRGTEKLTESSTIGDGFLPDLCHEWEQSTRPLHDTNVKIVFLRTGLVMTPMGGIMKRLLLPAKFGALGPVGSGKQMQSWISLDDEIYAIHHLMMDSTSEGPYNLTAPLPVPQKEFAKVLGRVLRRPAFAPLPGFVIKMVFGEMGKQLVLEGQEVYPERLVESGFEFTHTTLESCFRHCLGMQK